MLQVYVNPSKFIEKCIIWMFCTFISMALFADYTCATNGYQFAYTLSGKNATYIRGAETFAGEELIIPSVIDGHPVVSIGDDAFSTINNTAYSSCGKTFVEDGPISIGHQAFYTDGSGWSQVCVPGSVTTFSGNWCFRSIGTLYWTIASTNLTIDSYAFSIPPGQLELLATCDVPNKLHDSCRLWDCFGYYSVNRGQTYYKCPREYVANWINRGGLDRFRGYVDPNYRYGAPASVYFFSATGVVYAEQTGRQGCPYGNLPTCTMDGDEFLGWYTEPYVELGLNDGIAVTSADAVAGPAVCLFAHWKKAGAVVPDYVTVTYNANGGICQEASWKLVRGQKLYSMPSPTRVGFLFSGWYTDAEDGELVGADMVASQDATFFAHWVACAHGVAKTTIAAIAPTCTENGSTAEIVCSSCGHVLQTVSPVAALGHVEKVAKAAQQPTSGTSGCTTEVSCDRCGKVLQDSKIIPALGYIRNVTARQLWPHKKVEVCYDLAEDIDEVASENTALRLSAGTGSGASGDLTYVNDATYPWTVDTSTYHSGGSSWKSGNAGYGSTSSSRSVTVSGATKVSFYWKVTSESGYDKLHFYVDGSEVVSAISGSVGWTQVSYNLYSTSSHTLKWSYTKDGSEDTSSDCGWVDDVVVTYANQSYSAQTIIGNSQCVSGAHRIVWDVEKDGVSIDKSNLVFTVAYGTTSNVGTGCVNTTSAVCDGMSVGPSMRLACSAIDAREGQVEIDDTAVFSVVDGGSFTWQPLTKGEHAITHIAGTNVWTRTVNVTSLVYEEPTPNPPTAEDANFTISTTVRALTSTAKASGTIGTVKVDSSYVGTWSAMTSADWITLTYASRNVGLPVIYTVAENKGVEARTGYVYVSGHVFTITQPGVGAELDHYLDEFDQNGGEGTVTVLADSSSGWWARSNEDWISLETLCGTGECEVVYYVAPWAEVSMRNDGTITIAGRTFIVHQTGRQMKLSTESVEKDYLAYDIPVAVDALASTEWGIALDAPWLSIVERGSGKGAGTVTFAINENPSYLSRTATALIGTETFTILQTGRPTETLAFAISPEMTTASVKGANGVIAVEATPDLPWMATSQASWLTVMPGFSSGAGNGNVVYATTPNPTMAERTGAIAVVPTPASGLASRVHTVSQPAATSMISVDNHTFAVDGDSFALEVTVDDVVAWTVGGGQGLTVLPDWVTIDGETNRIGPGTVTIAVEPNMSIEPREATLTIAGHEFHVTQRGRTISLEYGNTIFAPDAYEEATIEVHPNGEVEWTAIPSDATWISVWSEDENCTYNADGSVSGTGDATLKYMVTAYVGDGGVKTGWITIGNEKIYVAQRAYDLSIDPCATNVTGNAGAGTIAVPANVDQIWNAIATEPWIKLVGSYDEVTGGGTVNYTFTDNDTGETRTGKIVIAGEEYTITQAARQLVTVTTTVMGEGGTVSGGGTYNLGASVKLTAIVSDDDHKFVEWEKNGSAISTATSLTVTADVDQEIVAVFEKIKTYVVNDEEVKEGTVKFFSAPVPVVMGGTTQLVCLGTSAYPNKGTSFQIQVTGNIDFEWDLWQTNYFVSITQTAAGTVSGTTGWVAADAEVTFTATPSAGKSFYRWSGFDGGQGLTSLPSVTTRVSRPLTVSAIFGTFADTLATAADAPSLTFTTGGEAAWTPVIDATAQTGYSSVRTGAIGAESESWLETTVSGAGTLSFQWRTDCEHDDGGEATWDRLAVFVNGVEKARLDGTTDWQTVELPLTDAKSVIRWSFYRDDYDASGTAHENCGWIDSVEVK